MQQDTIGNLLLRRLNPLDYGAIAPSLELIQLGQRELIVKSGAPMTYAWFPDTAVASIIATSAAGRQADVGLSGREGMVDVAPINGSDVSPMAAVSQIPGRAYRLPVGALREAMASHEGLRTTLQLYAQSFVVQMSTTALVSISHAIDQRLARWLLMAHDRIDGDQIPVTHSTLSQMLGVRRAGVTMAIHKLESAATVRAQRGQLTIVDRAGLEEIARDAYGTAETEYARLMGTDFRRRLVKSNGSGHYTSTASRA